MCTAWAAGTERTAWAPGMERTAWSPGTERTAWAPGTELALERTLWAPGTERALERTMLSHGSEPALEQPPGCKGWRKPSSCSSSVYESGMPASSSANPGGAALRTDIIGGSSTLRLNQVYPTNEREVLGVADQILGSSVSAAASSAATRDTAASSAATGGAAALSPTTLRPPHQPP